ncbi:hypothetical protein PIB30_100399, partial [Stylosanthes scabra]|nr:hypothetical protein [Stylosanthes scabra]
HVGPINCLWASPPRNGNKATRDVAIPTRGVASTTSIPTRCEKGAVPILPKGTREDAKIVDKLQEEFSSHMGKLHAAHEEQKTKMGQTSQILVNHALDSQAGNMYTHWALQQPKSCPDDTYKDPSNNQR